MSGPGPLEPRRARPERTCRATLPRGGDLPRSAPQPPWLWAVRGRCVVVRRCVAEQVALLFARGHRHHAANLGVHPRPPLPSAVRRLATRRVTEAPVAARGLHPPP